MELTATIRTETGNGPARRLRNQGRVPAVLYGHHTDPTSLSVDRKELNRLLKNAAAGRSLIQLTIDGQDGPRAVMIKELQVDPLTDEVLHADFYQVDMNRKVRVSVPVQTTGKARGVELGGMLQIIRRELEVLCYPNQIPEAITIDITDLGLGDSVHVKDIPVEGDIEIPAEVDFTVLTVLAPKVEAAAEGEEEEGAEEEAEQEAETSEE